MNVTLTPIIIPLFDLQAEFPDLDSEDSVGKETGKDITGTDIESQNHEGQIPTKVGICVVSKNTREIKYNYSILHSTLKHKLRQRNNAFIAALHFTVTVGFSIMSINLLG
jgi:hypothetical protein